MSEAERTGTRDLTYSQWHRTSSLSRFVDKVDAWECGVIDIDWCEYCRYCKQPLALIETQASKATPKSATVTRNLAALAGISAYSVSFVVLDDEIQRFRLRQIWPTESSVYDLTPERYASFLCGLRRVHVGRCKNAPRSVA